MYNSEIKEEFIKSIQSESTRSVVRYTLESTAKYEESLEKDLIFFSSEEIDNIITSEFGTSSASRTARVSFIRMYFRWASNNGMNNNIQSLKGLSTNVSSSAMMDKYVFSPAHLSAYLDAVFDSIDLDTVDIISRALFWMAFCGVPIKDVETLKTNCVIEKDGGMMAAGIFYPLYDDALDVVVKLSKMKQFRLYNKIYASKYALRDRSDSDYLLRGIKRKDNKDVSDGKRHRSVMSDASKKLKAAMKDGIISSTMTYETVRKSGVFYKMYLREQAGIDVNFTTWIMSELSEKHNIDDKESIKTTLKNRRRLMNADYKAWKEAKKIYEDSLR